MFFNCTTQATSMFVRQFVSLIDPSVLGTMGDDPILDASTRKRLHEHVAACWGDEFMSTYAREANAIREIVDGLIDGSYVSHCIRQMRSAPV